ncbi:MAG TPA: 16S rRNA (cytosine(967)-C(5))-methyltransferase RsmB [Firmicutes bacterium]|nr:16S rRNA (cytosine(967)-C(5))-methyltransferase RsmB [Bacillota bacterium]
MKMTPARSVAIRALYRVNEEGGYANLLLPQMLAREKLSPQDRALATELVYGTLRWQKRLDWIIGAFSKRPLEKLDPWVRNILRLGAYQLCFLAGIPPHAAIYETVQLMKNYGHRGNVAFVNGVLRSILREGKKVQFPRVEEEPAAHLAVVYSHPQWLVERWLSRWGFAETKALLAANNQPAPLGLRVNTLKTTPAELQRMLEREGVQATPGRYLPEALLAEHAASLEQLASFRAGFFQVQDEASQLAVHVLAPRPGERILDACAAPGGKTTHIAQLMGDEGAIWASDVHPHKLDLIRENCRRLGIKSVHVVARDARKWGEDCKGAFQRVLVDAPCSGTGVLRRRPDARWRKRPADLEELPALQLEILRGVAPCVAVGGTLVYSTCSLEWEENQAVVQAFQQAEPAFRLDNLTPYLPPGLESPTAREGYIQLFPHQHGTDGFFVARLVRE